MRPILISFSLPLLAFLFFACNNSGTAPKPYYPERGYQHVEEERWFAHNKKGIPYTPELANYILTWRDAVAYNKGEFLALTAKRIGGLGNPRVVHIGAGQKPRVVFGAEFPRRFGRVSLDAQDYGDGNPDEEIALIMQYSNRESIVVMDPYTMAPIFLGNANDVSLVEDGGSKIIVETNYDGGVSMKAYRWNGTTFAETKIPENIKLSDKMMQKIKEREDELLSTFISNPSQALDDSEQLLRTDNPLPVSTALNYITRNVYAVDENGSRPLWQYFIEYDTKPGEARVRVALDPIATAYVLAKTGVGLTPLPWANGKPLALVVAEEVAKEGEENTYVNLRLVNENGRFKLEGWVEPGKRMVKLTEAAQTYAPVAEEKIREVQESLKSGTREGMKHIKEFRKEREEIGRKKQQESERQTEELKRKIKTEICDRLPSAPVCK